ncbi:competence/damage-inducible protein A [candidate division CSSED10-310 bacterium]|uniref:Competence/damage-inducible protein A n=1 Tax=candidate division CSSED10-310 bacterium TaxID=2855610 RepID=A0ABV6YV91_UNCC1
MHKVALISIGNELLEGRFPDSNAYWLARYIFKLGGGVSLFLSLPDIVAEIVAGLTYAHHRGATILITTGGLGPTIDDQTVEAVAEFAGLECVYNTALLKEIERKYRSLFEIGAVDFPELNDARRKMAELPLGAEALANSEGISPGIQMKLEWGWIFALPGVPAEMEAIFSQSIEPHLKSIFSGQLIKTRLVETSYRDESLLAPLISRIMTEIPGIYAKSQSQSFSPHLTLKVHFTARADNEAEAQRILDKAVSILYCGYDP